MTQTAKILLIIAVALIAIGRIDVPKSTAGGKCEIQTDTGDIMITIG